MGTTTRATGSTRTTRTAGKRRPPAPAAAAVDASRDGSDPDVDRGLNLAVLWGRCSAGVEVRTLESGRRLASFSVRTSPTASPRRRSAATESAPSATSATSAASATSVPVTVWDPPAWLDGVEADDPLVVVGTVRRRFFTTRGGGRGAKAEVEAVSVARATRGQLDRAWQRATTALDAIA